LARFSSGKLWALIISHFEASSKSTSENVCIHPTRLLLGNPHSVADIGKDRRLNKVASVTDAFSTDAQLGTFLLTTVNQIHYLLSLIGVNLPSTHTTHCGNRSIITASINSNYKWNSCEWKLTCKQSYQSCEFKLQAENKLAPYGTDGQLFTTDVSAKFKVT